MSNLHEAIKFAVWMVEEKNTTLKHAVVSACFKKDYPTKIHVENGVRDVLGSAFFKRRAQQNMPLKYQQARNNKIRTNKVNSTAAKKATQAFLNE